MKKLTAMLLALALLLGCCAALAEETATAAKENIGSINMNGAFKLQCAVPEGFEVTVVSKDDEGLLATVKRPEDKAAPVMFLVIEYDEQFGTVDRLNDLGEEDLQWIADTYSTEGEEVDISYTETSHGTKLMVVKNAGDVIAYTSFLTIYKGYFIEFDIVPGLDATVAETGLTAEQIQMCVDFLSDLDFIPEEEA